MPDQNNYDPYPQVDREADGKTRKIHQGQSTYDKEDQSKGARRSASRETDGPDLANNPPPQEG